MKVDPQLNAFIARTPKSPGRLPASVRSEIVHGH
jgi:hypothetical protein